MKKRYQLNPSSQQDYMRLLKLCACANIQVDGYNESLGNIYITCADGDIKTLLTSIVFDYYEI